MDYSVKLLAATITGLLWPLVTLAKSPEKTLNLDQMKHYQISIDKDIQVVFREGNKVWTAPYKAGFVIASAYNEAEKEADLGFGSAKNPLDGSERLSWGEDERRVRGIVRHQDDLLFLDNEKLQLLVYREKDPERKWRNPSDLILDLVKPARDAKGEATRKEQTALIARLRAALSKAKGRKDLFGGITTIPSSWKDRDGSQFLIWLRIPEAPLMTLKCSGENSCVTQRACFVRSFSKKDIEDVTGITRAGDKILLGMPAQGKVVKLDGKSCFSLSPSLAFRIPTRIKELSNVFVDDAENLWISSGITDDFTSASVFVWAKGSWPQD